MTPLILKPDLMQTSQTATLMTLVLVPFEGLVVENLEVDVLAGTPFMETNDITVRLAKR